MFDSVRNNKKIVQVFLALITVPFAFFGVESYLNSSGGDTDVATVGDSKITQQQFSEAWRGQLDEARKKGGPGFRTEQFDTPEARLAVVNALIDRRLLQLEAAKSRLGASDALLRDIIASMPSLQVDGRFSQERYESALRAQGMTPAQFEAQMRQDLTLQQLVGSVGDTGILPSAVAAGLLRIQSEERQVAEMRLMPESFLPGVKLEADAAQKFYEENRKRFETAEQLRAEYVVLSLDALMTQATVTDGEVRAWYDSHKDQYQQPEERRASHVLVMASASAPEAEKTKARAKAEALLKEIRQNPARFAEIAKRDSQDPGSADKGGDLGFFGRGMMVKPFEEAVFGQKEGEISGLVQSDFGFHIIKVTGIKPGRVRTVDEVRPEIEGELKRQAAQRKFAEAAEGFTNLVYEQSESLTPVAEKYGLKIQQSQWLPRAVPPQALPSLGPLGNERLLAALYADDALKNKRNTEAVEVSPNTVVAARVLEYKPATLRPFESVRADIETQLRLREATAAARKAGEEALAKLKQGEDKVNWTLVKTVSRLQGKQVPPAAMQAIFQASVDTLPAFAGVELPNGGGYALYKIMKVTHPEQPDDSKQKVLQRDYTALVAQEDFAAYLAALRQRYKITVHKGALENRDRAQP